MECPGAIPTSQPAWDAVLGPVTRTCAGSGIYGFVKGLELGGVRQQGRVPQQPGCLCPVSALSSCRVFATEGLTLWKVT